VLFNGPQKIKLQVEPNGLTGTAFRTVRIDVQIEDRRNVFYDSFEQASGLFRTKVDVGWRFEQAARCKGSYCFFPGQEGNFDLIPRDGQSKAKPARCAKRAVRHVLRFRWLRAAIDLCC